MNKSITELMGIKFKDLKKAIEKARDLEKDGLYKKTDRELLELAYHKKQEQEKLLINKRIHAKLIENLKSEIERTEAEVNKKKIEADKLRAELILAENDKYSTEISEFESTIFGNKKQWSIHVIFNIDGEEVTTYLFLDREIEQ